VTFETRPVAFVRSPRADAVDDDWDAIASVIELVEDVPRVYVSGLDAIDGTPVVDLKPVMREFLPREDVRQPAWATELMRGYWTK
jgi:tRNA (Thr-GGU) A37 N-methylase